MKSSEKTILYIQVAEPAAYPPLIHSAVMLADAGWRVTVLASPSADKPLAFPEHRNIDVLRMPLRPTHVVGKIDYGRYCLRAAFLAKRIRPAAVYASDPLGSLPGYLAARLSGARLVYHEHDSPGHDTDLHPVVRKTRVLAARAAEIVVFPNMQRAEAAQRQLKFNGDNLHVVWNVPRRSEIPPPVAVPEAPLILYYHGSIAPDLLPASVAAAVAQFDGKAVLRIAGYETEGGRGYIRKLLSEFGPRENGGYVEYVGLIDRENLLSIAARAHVGLALMPRAGGNVNLRQMVGASNKAFDYMAAGLPLLVSDLPDWRETFVHPRHALAVDPASPGSVADAVRYLLDHPGERAEMGRRNRQRIISEWNYDRQFRPVSIALANPARNARCRGRSCEPSSRMS